MEREAGVEWIREAEQEKLRQKIENKRKRLDAKIRGRADLLKYQELSIELDQLIGQYLDQRMGGLPDG